ncbi:MAG: DUF2484 family protein [Rhodobacteraceae bacterium]|nr:DUF2484 family protein [Paracoccaceae bacterium]
MMGSLVAACLWLIAANLRAMFPSRDHLWRFAYVMIALAIPVVIWLYMEQGIWITLIFLIAAASLLRWPLIYLWRWLRTRKG